MSECYFLENDFLKVTLHPKGAELRSLVSKKTGLEYMWNADPAWWSKTSPVLFPIVGTLRNNSYRYNGVEYTLPRHGFARDRFFLAEQTSPLAISFILRDDADTRAQYPFSFSLTLFYQLDEDRLLLRYTVENTGREQLWFSLGAHPAFAVPPQPLAGAAYTDHYLQFDRSESLVRYKLEEGLIGTETELVLLPDKKLPLQPALFREDALVLKHIPDHSIVLGSSQHAHGLEFAWEGFPFFGIWAPAGAPFVCLEPWYGIADSVAHDQELTRKEGIESLPPGESFSREWSARPF